jgi:hypothetical protein
MHIINPYTVEWGVHNFWQQAQGLCSSVHCLQLRCVVGVLHTYTLTSAVRLLPKKVNCCNQLNEYLMYSTPLSSNPFRNYFNIHSLYGVEYLEVAETIWRMSMRSEYSVEYLEVAETIRHMSKRSERAYNETWWIILILLYIHLNVQRIKIFLFQTNAHC